MKYEAFTRQANLRFSDFTLAGATKNYAPDLKLEPIHTELHLSVDVKGRSARGYALITIRANVEGADSLDLDAVDFNDLQVSDVDDKGLTHNYDGKQIKLKLSKTLKAQDKRMIRIDYSIQDPITGLKFSQPDARRPDFPFYAITDNETERARYWFPCVDFPTVRPHMEYFLSAPEALTILANGALVSEEIKDGIKTAHWRLNYPCPAYLACFAIGEFSEYQDEPLRDMPIAYYADKSYTPEQLKRTFEPTRKMLIWMEKKLGMDFPYPKYFQIAGREIGGAMENISLVTWDDKFMLDENMAREWKYIMDLINVHEMSHSYFGDAVVSYDFAHVWLKESWATYIESVWLEDSEGKEAMDWQLAEEARSYMGEAKNSYVRPIITREYDHSWNMFDQHLYPGGAWRLHMLRQLVGDAKFWKGVQDYVNSYAGRTVKSIDFQRCIEKHSGMNLDSFFDTWFYSKGYPILNVAFAYDKEKGRGKFTVEQKQMDKEKGIGLFEMDLDLAWQDGAGKDHVETVHLSKGTHIFQLKLEEPAHVSLDPEMKTLFEAEFNTGDDKLLHLLKHGHTVRDLMQAISELARTGKRKNLQAIRDHLKSEKHWGLRIHAYRELGTVGNEYAYAHLAELLVTETDPMVIEAAAVACGKQRHPVLREAILTKLTQKHLPYRGQMALLSSLGSQKIEADIKLLEEYAGKDGWRNLNRAGAYIGLGASHSEKAVDALLSKIEDSVNFYEEKVARLTALSQIKDWVSPHLKIRVSEAICEATKDPSYFVHVNAARLIGATGIQEGLPYLKALMNRIPVQDHPLLKRQIQALQVSGNASETKKLQKQLDELSEKLAGMEKRLQEVESEK
ncbi:MAG: HEAT repeat domain-containing protein [Candidatus Marinimicrobia bacterium]|nr:HEAT repeat domain-containing protein [Candidatus Neomarinimicrobiota bacterium]